MNALNGDVNPDLTDKKQKQDSLIESFDGI